MPGVRVSPLGPTKVAEKDATPETLAAARVSAVSEEKSSTSRDGDAKGHFRDVG